MAGKSQKAGGTGNAKQGTQGATVSGSAAEEYRRTESTEQAPYADARTPEQVGEPGYNPQSPTAGQIATDPEAFGVEQDPVNDLKPAKPRS